MTLRQATLRVFGGEPLAAPLFQPRLEPWFHWHRIFGRLPPELADRGLRGLYEDLGVSMRYMQYYTGVPHPVVRELAPEVGLRELVHGDRRTIVYETPHGELVEDQERTVDRTWRTVGFAVRSRDDLRRLRWLFEHMTYSFDTALFEVGDRFVGDLGVPQFWVPKSPYQALAQQWIKLPDLVYALTDAPAEVEDVMKAIDASYDRLYEEMTAGGRLRIVNFGENIHEQLLSPRWFERYLVPFWTRRAGALRAAGVYTHVHIDGSFRNLLRFLRHLPFDGLEALTPKPQGDVELEEIREHIGDKILLDGIPAVLFLPTYPREAVLAAAEKIVALFHPRLILGVSDEVPEGAGLQAIERVRLVSDWCRRQTPTV
jgi:hypothetical protein